MRFLGQIAMWGGALLAVSGASAELVYRWSFSETDGAAPAGTVLNDSVAAFPMTVRGQGAVFDAGSIILPGTTRANVPESQISAYLDLPNGIVSSRTNVTLEFWAVPLGARDCVPDADPDGDGNTNHEEYLGGTDPVDPQSRISWSLAVEDGDATLALALPAGRWFEVETSTDLVEWFPWNVPGNNRLPVAAGVHSLTAPIPTQRQFFRLRVGAD